MPKTLVHIALALFVFEAFILCSLLVSKALAAVPASEAICVFQGDLIVMGAVNPNLDVYADSFTLRQLAEIEVSLLSETPLRLLTAAGSFSGTKDDAGVTLGPCAIVGVGFFVELDRAVFDLSDKKASGVSYVLSDSSIKTIAAKYVTHPNTFSSVIYHPEEIRLNRLRLLPFIPDTQSKQIPVPKDTKEKLSAKTHTIDVVWDTKKLFSGKATFEHNGNEKLHRQALLGCALQEYFRIPFQEIESVANGTVTLVSSEQSPPFKIVIDGRLSATLVEMNLVPHPVESACYQISPLLWPKITERLIEARNLSFFKHLSAEAGK